MFKLCVRVQGERMQLGQVNNGSFKPNDLNATWVTGQSNGYAGSLSMSDYGVLQANASKILVNDGEMLVNDEW